MHKQKDAYDSDVDSTSPYDDAGNINQGNPYMKTADSEAVLPGPGLQEIEASVEKKLKEAKAEKAADESGVPAAPEQETAISAKEGATEGFTGAIPYAFKDKKLGKDYEAVGAPKADKKSAKKAKMEEKKAAEEIKAEEAGQAEADTIAEGAVAEEMKKEEAGAAANDAAGASAAANPDAAPAELEGVPVEQADPEAASAAAEEAAALAQKPRRRHHRRHHHRRH